MKIAKSTLAVFTLLAYANLSLAQLGGGKIIRVDDKSGAVERCIDPHKDKVWLTLRSLTVSKGQHWFTKDTDVSVLIKASVQTDPPPTIPLQFPLLSVAKIGDGPAGQYSIPIEYPIVSGLVLKQSPTIYNGLGAEITLINLKDRNNLGTALQVLESITNSNKLPIPASPAVTAASYLVSFANSAVQKDIDAQKASNKAVAGAMQFTFDLQGSCSEGDFEKTGTKAIIYSEGTTDAPGYVPLDQLDKRCFTAQLLPSFSLRSAPRPTSGNCKAVVDSDFKLVANNYIAFYLNKQFATRTLAANDQSKLDLKESIARCRANGVSEKQCFR